MNSDISPYGGINLNNDDHNMLLAYALEEKTLFQYVIQGHDGVEDNIGNPSWIDANPRHYNKKAPLYVRLGSIVNEPEEGEYSILSYEYNVYSIEYILYSIAFITDLYD